MELSQLRYFQALAKNGNLTQTAKELFISAPALSTSISRLEQEVGAPLFDRVKGRMYLNDCGRAFLQEVAQGLAKLETGQEKVRLMAGLEERRLTLVTLNKVLWNGLIADFITHYPDVHLTVINSSSSNILRRQADAGRFDLLLGSRMPSLEQEMESMPLFTDNSVMVCLPSNHPLAGQSSLKLTELKDERLIFPPANYKLNAFYYRICAETGFQPNVIAECDYVLSAYLHKRGLGIAFTSRRAHPFDIFSDSVMIPVEDATNDMVMSQNIYWDRQRERSSVAKQFCDFALRYFAD